MSATEDPRQAARRIVAEVLASHEPDPTTAREAAPATSPQPDGAEVGVVAAGDTTDRLENVIIDLDAAEPGTDSPRGLARRIVADVLAAKAVEEPVTSLPEPHIAEPPSAESDGNVATTTAPESSPESDGNGTTTTAPEPAVESDGNVATPPAPEPPAETWSPPAVEDRDVAFERELEQGGDPGPRTGRWLLTTVLGALALAWLFPMAVAALRDLVALS